MLKEELRKKYLAMREGLSTEDRDRRSVAVANRFFSSIDLSDIRTLHIFLPVERFNEIDTWILIYRIWSEFPLVRLCSPRVDTQSGEMTCIALEKTTQIRESIWGVPEPVGDERIEPTELDLVVVPLLCADSKGYRVGYGKGYYDRFLSKCRTDCLKVGLSCFPPIEEISDVNEYDVRLDELIFP